MRYCIQDSMIIEYTFQLCGNTVSVKSSRMNTGNYYIFL